MSAQKKAAIIENHKERITLYIDIIKMIMSSNFKACNNYAENSNSSSSSGFMSSSYLRTIVVFLGFGLACIVIYNSLNQSTTFPSSYYFARSQSFRRNSFQANSNEMEQLANVLKNAAMKDKTVIITTLNEAWAEPNSIYDLFMKSFRNGNNTKRLLEHLIVVCLDKMAYARCLEIHPHCYELGTEGANFSSEAFFMTPDYLKMMWRRIGFLASVLEMGYNFLFTDADIMWLRNPFGHFNPDADFQIACDYFSGNSSDIKNKPNGGFTYVKSNEKTVLFYKFWYFSRNAYPKMHDQDVLNKIKFDPFITEIGLKIGFLDTAYFGGFCQPSKDLNKVCTMHANCCVGLHNKVNDLKILLDDWKTYISTNKSSRNNNHSWTVPQKCRTSFQEKRNFQGGHIR